MRGLSRRRNQAHAILATHFARPARAEHSPRPALGFKHDFSRVPLRTKLTISRPGDAQEREADRLAEQVMRMRATGGETLISETAKPATLHRKCGACTEGGTACSGCEADEEKRIQRSAEGDNASPHMNRAAAAHLTSPSAGGAPLLASVRAWFEPRLGRSFGDVRVHTDARAAASAHAVQARAYTLGTDIVFAAGQFAPQHHEGQHLLAHELVHVVQNDSAAERRISRDEAVESTSPAMSTEEGGADGELETLLAEITDRMRKNIDLRQQLDALPPASSPERDNLSKTLDTGRTSLMTLLEQRVGLLKIEIANLWIELSGEGLASTTGKPENDARGTRLNRYEQELNQHEDQIEQLTRWQTRQRMSSIDTQLAEIDFKLAQLPPVSDPAAPMAELLLTRRNELVEERKSLARSLTSTAHEYKQFDPRWGAIHYGVAKECSSVKEGGCGPTALAMLLNFLYAEDPEAVKAGPIEFVTPDETAAYAATHGRVCGNGTSGTTMVTQLSTQWPGYRGRAITLAQATGELRNGNLVIFLCHSCTGKTRSNKDRSYGGHFMVLNGLDNSGETFNVLDSGSNEAADIETITLTNLSKHGAGYWIGEKK